MSTLIIDTDCGVDDALALVLALGHADFNIIAITCCFGNTSLNNVWQNVYRVLTVCHRTNIPVFVGCDRNLVGDSQIYENFHGEDGFGNISLTIPIPNLKPKEEPAPVAMVRMANENPGEITLLAMGPLTNLAVALRLDPTFSSKLKRLIFMGGNIEGQGNISASSEFNFYCDPEAAHVVLGEFTCPILCIPWETCLGTKLTWDEYGELTNMKTEKAEFMKNLTKNSIALLHQRKRQGYHCCDLCAVAVIVDDRMATEVIKCHAAVEIAGSKTRGQMIVDRRPWATAKPNVDIVVKLDRSLLYTLAKNMLL